MGRVGLVNSQEWPGQSCGTCRGSVVIPTNTGAALLSKAGREKPAAE